eukprot:g24490.t1
MSIRGLLPSHNDITRKLEEQHLIFCIRSLQHDSLNIEFTSFKISPPLALSHMLYKMVSESPLGLTDVEEATSGAVNTVHQVDRCAGEPLSNVEGLLCALIGGNARDVVEGIFSHQRGQVTVLEIGHLGCAGVERPILGADAAEVEEL